MNKMNKMNKMSKGLIASSIIALTSFSFNAFPVKGMTVPGEDGPIATNYVPNSQTKYIIRCYGGCDPYERINVFVTVQKGFINFKNSDLFIIKDDDVTVNSITYYQFTNYKSKYTLQQIPNGYFKDSPLNCYSDAECSEWRKDPKTAELLDIVQNFSHQYQVSQFDYNFQNVTLKLQAAYLFAASWELATIAAGTGMGYLGLTLFSTEATGLAQLAIVTNKAGLLGAASTSVALAINWDAHFTPLIRPGDILIFKNGNIIKVIRDGKTYTAEEFKKLATSQTQTNSGGSGSGGHGSAGMAGGTVGVVGGSDGVVGGSGGRSGSGGITFPGDPNYHRNQN